MNCRIVISKLSEYVDQELGGREMLLVRDHLHQCPQCAKEHAFLVGLKQRMGSMKLEEPTLGFEARLRDAVYASAAPKSTPKAAGLSLRAAVVTAVAAASLSLLALKLMPSTPAEPVSASSTTADWVTDQTSETARDPFVGISVAPVSHSGR